MTAEEVGMYIRLLCLQHQKGHLREKDMLSICKAQVEDVFSKFTKDGDGLYFNERLEREMLRRRSYSESRRKNALKKPGAYAQHMETETETETIINQGGMGGNGFSEDQIRDLRSAISSSLGHGIMSQANEICFTELMTSLEKPFRTGKIKRKFAYALKVAKNLKETGDAARKTGCQ